MRITKKLCEIYKYCLSGIIAVYDLFHHHEHRAASDNDTDAPVQVEADRHPDIEHIYPQIRYEFTENPMTR